jgi:very-short-patch-repair endonuclease
VIRANARVTNSRDRRARELRRSETAAEAKLWTRLRNRGLNGFKFVRQASIGAYFADFVCRDEKLIIEVDGATHGTERELAKDKYRTDDLAERGYQILRVSNDDVFHSIDAVLATILAALERRVTG